MITIDDFFKAEIKIGKIVSAERIEGSDKLLKLSVDLGGETRQVVAGIGKQYEPEFLIGKELPIVSNLEPKSLKGVESNGMILAASKDGVPVIISPIEEVPPGSIVK